MLEEKNIKVEFDQSKKVTVIADNFYIDQVVTNYFTNAIKHAIEVNGKKQIKIEIEERENNKVRIKVFNTGEKIKEENLNKIWQRFYKEDTSRNRAEGRNRNRVSTSKSHNEQLPKQLWSAKQRRWSRVLF